MKQFSLQSMKRGIVAAVLTLVYVFVSAQDVRMVTLQHGDDVQVFRGTTAFKSAVAAAQKGDLITLSQGTFDDAGTIDKVLTIQGAGYRNTTTQFSLNLPEGEEGMFIEGINFNSGYIVVSGYAKNITFKRCRFSSCTNFNNCTSSISIRSSAENILIQECRMYYFNGYANQSIVIQNSAIYTLSCNGNSSVVADHCYITELGNWPLVYYSVVATPHDNADANPLYYSIYGKQTNCRKVGCWHVGSARYNDYYSYWKDSPFMQTNANGYGDTVGVHGWDSSNALTEYAASTYLDDNGTQVGMYGGTLGFSEEPANPKIVEASIPRQVDDNGQLHVHFKVEARK